MTVLLSLFIIIMHVYMDASVKADNIVKQTAWAKNRLNCKFEKTT